MKTLGDYHERCLALYGVHGASVRFFADKIAASPNGDAEPVLADESQMLHLIGNMEIDALTHAQEGGYCPTCGYGLVLGVGCRKCGWTLDAPP